MKRLLSSQSVSTIQSVRVLESGLLIVADHLRRRFARFKLCAHLLDLRCLLVQTRRHSFHSFLLLRDLPAEIGSCDLPEAE